MKTFLDENFLLKSKSAERLYHEFAKEMPIIDYHNHLPPAQVAEDSNFQNITQAWLYGDHYKWRAMRANGINEAYCTGEKSDEEKFQKWAETVPYTLRNPLYHWTHLELQRYFGIHDILNGQSASNIYAHASEQLRTKDFSCRNLLNNMNVKVICTTDDPTDSLEHHKAYRAENQELKMLPTFRPDKFINIESLDFLPYISKLAAVVGYEIDSFESLLKALSHRIDDFNALGCRLSDHGLSYISADDFTEENVSKIFKKAIESKTINQGEINEYKSALLHHLGVKYAKLGWTQQFHLGAIRNNNTRAMRTLGPDTGWDSIGDWSQASTISKFLAKLDENDQLAKTIIYNLNPSDNEMIAAMTGNFNDGSIAGKIQFGSGWWFLDQKDGMTKQINALSNMGLLSRFVGMLTDSRSFLSFPRHEYFRRILCNILGEDIENGELPNDIAWTGQVVQDICYNNANTYFKF